MPSPQQQRPGLADAFCDLFNRNIDLHFEVNAYNICNFGGDGTEYPAELI